MDYTELSLNNVRYYPPTKINNRYISKVFYQDQDEMLPLRIVTPALRAKSGICVSENRCYLQLELDRQHEDLYNFFTDLDDQNIQVMFKNSKAWFNRSIPLDVIDDNYTTFVKASRQPLIKVRVPYKNGKIDLDIHVGEIEKETLVKLVLEYEGIKFLQRQASNLWIVKDIRIISDDEEIEYDFHDYEDGMGDLMLQELNLTIQEAIDKANRSECSDVEQKNEVEQVLEPTEYMLEPTEYMLKPVEENHVEENHVEENHVEENHVEENHVEENHVEENHVEENHVEENYVEENHVEEEQVEEEQVEEEQVEEEQVEEEQVEEEQVEEEQVEEEQVEEEQTHSGGKDKEGSDLDDESGLASDDIFDNIVDRVLGNVIDPNILETRSRRRRKKIIVGGRVRIV